MIKNIRVDLTLRIPLEIDSSCNNNLDIEQKLFLKNKFKQMISELNLLKIKLPLLENYCFCNLSFNITKKDLEYWFHWGICSIYTSVDPDKIELPKDFITPKPNKEETPNLIFWYIMDEIINFIQDFSIIVNISYPGLFHIINSNILINGEKYSDHDKIKNNAFVPQGIYGESILKKWPEFIDIPITKTLEWIKNRTNFLYGLSENGIDRALNVLSYIAMDRYDGLFYAIMGIEAIYIGENDKIEIGEKIERRVKLLIGKPKEFKKQIKQMYNARSKFIHGKINFTKNNFMYDGDERCDHIDKDYRDSLNIALCILIATIQNLISNDKSEITEDYIINLK